MVLKSLEDGGELLFIAVLFKKPEAAPQILVYKTHLEPYESESFQSTKTNEALIAASRDAVEKTATGCRLSEPFERTDEAAELRGCICHTQVRDDDLSGVVMTQEMYPKRMAQGLIQAVLDSFSHTISKEQWSAVNEGKASYDFELEEYFTEYKYEKDGNNDPSTRKRNAAMLKIEEDNDELIMEMHNIVQTALQRSEAMDELNDKSGQFHRKARRSKSQCCIIL